MASSDFSQNLPADESHSELKDGAVDGASAGVGEGAAEEAHAAHVAEDDGSGTVGDDEFDAQESQHPVVTSSGRGVGIAIISILVVIVFGVGFLLGRLSLPGASFSNVASKPAADIPDVDLPAFKGRLAELKGGPVIVNFWASWCTPCRAEAPALQRIYNKYKGQGVQLIGVNTSDTPSGAQGFVSDFDISYPNVRDGSDAISVAYGVNAMPTTIFIDKDGKIVDTAMGQINEEKFDAYIKSFLETSGG